MPLKMTTFDEIPQGTIFRALDESRTPRAYIKIKGGTEIGLTPIGNAVCLTGPEAGERVVCGRDEAVYIYDERDEVHEAALRRPLAIYSQL